MVPNARQASAVLIFIGREEGKMASGLPMIPRPILKTGKVSYSATLATRKKFSKVETYWPDRDVAARKTVTAGDGRRSSGCTTYIVTRPKPDARRGPSQTNISAALTTSRS